MPKPWEAAVLTFEDGEYDTEWDALWNDVDPSELEFGIVDNEDGLCVFVRPIGVDDWDQEIPLAWVEEHLPEVLWDQVMKSVFEPRFRMGVAEAAALADGAGLRHNPELDDYEQGPRLSMDQALGGIMDRAEERGSLPHQRSSALPLRTPGESLTQELRGNRPLAMLVSAIGLVLEREPDLTTSEIVDRFDQASALEIVGMHRGLLEDRIVEAIHCHQGIVGWPDDGGRGPIRWRLRGTQAVVSAEDEEEMEDQAADLTFGEYHTATMRRDLESLILQALESRGEPLHSGEIASLLRSWGVYDRGMASPIHEACQALQSRDQLEVVVTEGRARWRLIPTIRTLPDEDSLAVAVFEVVDGQATEVGLSVIHGELVARWPYLTRQAVEMTCERLIAEGMLSRGWPNLWRTYQVASMGDGTNPLAGRDRATLRARVATFGRTSAGLSATLTDGEWDESFRRHWGAAEDIRETAESMDTTVEAERFLQAIIDQFGGDVDRYMSFEDIERGVTPYSQTLLRRGLDHLIEHGFLVFIHDQTNNGFRLVKQVPKRGAGRPSALDRLMGGGLDL